MTSFSITQQITRGEYVRFTMRRTYRKWYIILISILGALLLFISIQMLTGVLPKPAGGRTPMGLAVFALVSLPLLVWSRARKTYKRNPRMGQVLTYTFSNTELLVQGDLFESRYSWTNIRRIRNTAHFILIYYDRKQKALIRKGQLNAREITFVLSKGKK